MCYVRPMPKKLHPDKQRRFTINDPLYKTWLVVMTGGTRQQAATHFVRSIDSKDEWEVDGRLAEGSVFSRDDCKAVGIYFMHLCTSKQ